MDREVTKDEAYDLAREWRVRVLDEAEDRAGRWRTLAFAASAVGVLGLVLATIALPFKEFVPVVVEVEKSTGDVAVYSSFEQGERLARLTRDQTIIASELTKFIRAYEGWIPELWCGDRRECPDNDAGWLYVQERASAEVYAQYNTLFSNPETDPRQVYDDDVARVTILSVSFLTDTVAQVRFQIERMRDGVATDDPSVWVAVIGWSFEVDEGKSLASRWNNPLNFQVVRYEVSRENT